MTGSTATSLVSKRLIDDQLWYRLVNRVVREKNLDRSYAERIMDQTLGFLQLCAWDPDVAYSPSSCVDVGWHTFILYTREYTDFCQEIAGHYIHHLPVDHDLDTEMVLNTNTAVAMKAHGILVDDPLWLADGDCAGQKCYTCTT